MGKLKGGHSLFNDVFPIESNVNSSRPGPSEENFDDRNRCLLNQYVYFSKQTGIRYELMIRIIARNFWLSETRVYNILKQNHHLLVSIRNNMPVKTELKKKWPQLNWELPNINDYI